MTKAQQKRAVKAIYAKSEKLYFAPNSVVTLKDLEAIRRICNKWGQTLTRRDR